MVFVGLVIFMKVVVGEMIIVMINMISKISMLIMIMIGEGK